MGDRFDLRQAKISNTAIGNHATTYNNSSADDASIPDLIKALASSREAIAESAPTPADRTEVLEALDRIEAELRSDKPRGAAVSARWQTVTSLVGTLSEPAGKIAELVTKLFG
ncbi:hypothetical protein [Amycolatopsis alba]|uniref:DUF4404 domain-containing protein n=1 Tax=Amycolatopsis alba DSM 44262 TaxID=1125972 RepID=A0A229S7H3_AMYAL|nr:hypothetical protein [Amycolatopsis alba]OXM54902.1 hypothetical protein CFP75_01800 [Amycolatopsis alba DSM 44262]